MRVRVKDDESCFVGGVLYTSGVEFTIEPIECSVEKDSKGDPRIISVDEQFTESCMICLDEKPAPKKKAAKKIEIVKQEEKNATY